MTDDLFRFIVQSLIEYAYDSISDRDEKEDEFNRGRAAAFHEALSVVKSSLEEDGYDPSEYELGIDLDKMFS